MKKITVTIESEKRSISFIYIGDLISLDYMKKDLIKGLKKVLEELALPRQVS